MSHQIRPGVRGGRDQFSWDQVKEDKQRLNYLGSSIHGVPDKFKRGPETFWYAKESKVIKSKLDSEDVIEIQNIKDKENQMMEKLLYGCGLVKKEGIPEVIKFKKEENIETQKSNYSHEINYEKRYTRDNQRRYEDEQRYYRDSRRHNRDIQRYTGDVQGSSRNRESYNRHYESYDVQGRSYKTDNRSRSPRMYK